MSPRRVTPPPASRSQLKNVALFTKDDELSPTTIPLDQITLPATQPRRYFDPKAMQSLAASVKSNGILQPLLVRPLGANQYELVAGERRYRAARSVGLTEVPVTVKQLTDERALQYALAENLQREDLNPVEEVEGILQLLAIRLGTDSTDAISLLNRMAKAKRGLADNVVRPEEQQIVEDVFASVGRLSPESFRTHRLPLLNLPDEVLTALREGQIEYTKAKEIAKLKSSSERSQLLKEAMESNLTLSQIRERLKALTPPTVAGELQTRWDSAYKKMRSSKVWDNQKKRQKLESLLSQMEELIASAD